MTTTRNRTLVAAALAASALGAQASPAAAQEVSALSCRVEIPLTIDDNGRPYTPGKGTTACHGHLGQSVIAGDGKGSLQRLTVQPATGGGFAIRAARVRSDFGGLTAAKHPTSHFLNLDLSGTFRTGTAAAQPLTGSAVDNRGHNLSVVASAARLDGTCAARRGRCINIVPSKLVLKLTLREEITPVASLTPGAAPLAGLL